MLLLGRKRLETVVIEIPPSTEPRRVAVTVLRGGPVCLGFEAERDISIWRAELPAPNERAA